MAMIKAGLTGNVKAYTAICGVLKTEEELKYKNNEIEKQRVEIEKLKSQIHGDQEEYESDGFMEALKASAETISEEGEEFIET
ncbi:MAG: hypothetical protein IJP31_04655 [Lachnospiraceae bacterium]|nr:hypothetical protein [Lachnospiraceae bacterium]